MPQSYTSNTLFSSIQWQSWCIDTWVHYIQPMRYNWGKGGSVHKIERVQYYKSITHVGVNLKSPAEPPHPYVAPKFRVFTRLEFSLSLKSRVSLLQSPCVQSLESSFVFLFLRVSFL
jgi:hypothetical protein